MRATPWVLAAGLAACATVNHGRVAAHGDAAGSDWSIAPTACLSGTAFIPQVDMVAFTSDDGTPAAIKMLLDPEKGEVLQIIRDVNGQAVTQTFGQAQCSVLSRGVAPTMWQVNGVPIMRVNAQIDCTANGVNVAGTVKFSSCGYSRAAVSALTALASAPSPAEVARMAALPRVPRQVDVPPFPTALRGLSFRASAHIVGAPAGEMTVDQAGRRCIAASEKFFADGGWVPVRDPAAHADLDVEVSCSGHMSWKSHDGVMEILLPEGDVPGAIFRHDGVVIESVPRNPTDTLCESTAKNDDARARDCVERLGKMGLARVVAALTASQAIAAVAAHR